MDPLTQQLIQRQLSLQAGPPTQSQVPLTQTQAPTPPIPATPPNPHGHMPTEALRFANAQQIQSAYRGGWSPNPVLLQASLTK